jgi:hypothetical protein
MCDKVIGHATSAQKRHQVKQIEFQQDRPSKRCWPPTFNHLSRIRVQGNHGEANV